MGSSNFIYLTMINLLPENNKIEIKKEYTRRLFVVIGAFTFFVALISAVILTCLLFLINREKNNFNRQLFISEQRFEFKDLKEILPGMENFAAKLSFLEKESDGVKLSFLLGEILKRKSENVKINGFSYDKISGGGRILISGMAGSRQGLLSFVDALRSEPKFKDVQSPVSNLLKEKSLDFSLTILINE